MKTVSLVNPNFQQGPKELNAHYLPYSAGVVLSYSFADANIKNSWQLGDIVWRRDPIEATAQKLSSSDIVAFSTYVWNHRYNYALAKRIKEINPNVLTVFGGPEPAITDPELFVKEPFMDIVVKMEGEITFKRILETFNQDYTTIPGILYNNKGTLVDTGNSVRIDNLDNIPSPYLSGIFDKLIAENPDITWNATIETNRGCPYQCTFCDWGSLTYSKIKKFNLQRVFDELEWMGQRCGFIDFADANFGIFIERDNLIIDKLIEVQKKYGKIKSFAMTWAKNQKNEVVDMVKKLSIESGSTFGQGLTVSVQSMDDNVLDIIKRRNLEQHKIEEIFELCDRSNIPVYTELILGLPGETIDSWKEGFWKIFRAGNHNGINIHQSQLLENAEMNLTQRKDWGLQAVPIYDYIGGSQYQSEIQECVEVVVATKDIPRETMVDILVWNNFIQAFHIDGLTTYITRFLKKHNNIDYKEFYEAFYTWIQNDPWLSQKLKEARYYSDFWTKEGKLVHPDIGSLKINGFNLPHRTTLFIQHEDKLNHVYDCVKDFVKSNYNLDDDILEQLIRFQKNYIIDYKDLISLPLVEDFDYDFLGYLQYDSTLGKNTTYNFDTKEDKTMSQNRFLENMYFGRKRNFGKTIITKVQL